MNINHIKEFSKELTKIALPIGAMLNVGFGAMSIAGVHGAAKSAGNNLGKIPPLNLKPSTAYSFNANRDFGKTMSPYQS